VGAPAAPLPGSAAGPEAAFGAATALRPGAAAVAFGAVTTGAVADAAAGAVPAAAAPGDDAGLLTSGMVCAGTGCAIAPQLSPRLQTRRALHLITSFDSPFVIEVQIPPSRQTRERGHYGFVVGARASW
jgi:hypothetical protein